MSRQQVSCETHMQIDVCVLNPPDGQPVRKLTKSDFENLDLFADVSKSEQGRPPVLTLGCRLNNLWVPIRLREPNRWWDRLSNVPKRFLSATDTPVTTLPVISECTQNESSKRLTSLPKRISKKQEQEQPFIVQKYFAGDSGWWNRLNSLPPRKIIYQQSIFRKYQPLLEKLTENENTTQRKRNKLKVFRKDEYIKKRNNKHFVEELQNNITLNDATFSNEYIMGKELNNLYNTDENEKTSDVQLLDNSKEVAVSELLEILRLEAEEAKGSLSFDFDKLSAVEEMEEEKIASLEDLLSDELLQVSDETTDNTKKDGTIDGVIMQESENNVIDIQMKSDRDVFEEEISTESASERGTLEIISNIDTDEADTQSDLGDIDWMTIPEGDDEKESPEAFKHKSATEQIKRKKRSREVDLGTEPWWERLSKPPKRILAALYVPLTKPIKTRRRKWVGTSDEYWVERLSKPRRPVVRRESFKPKRPEINKRSRRLLQRKRKGLNGNEYWWLRLSKPRGIQEK